MLTEKRVWHWGVAAPAEKTHICLKSHIWCPVYRWIRFYGMAQETYRLAVHLKDGSLIVQHDMRVNLVIAIFVMTFEADRSSVSVWASPQKLGGSLMRGPTMDFMAGPALNLAFVQGERQSSRIRRNKIHGMMVFFVFVTVQTN